ncbi:YppG family protein [Evansella clarkii]|uniref:YppG family protein n=1 Tax=Evansella clarkii TaxID=79879 RepID=UPI0009978490|nr:YppG family protein [Evansella clarkii]
MYYPPNHGRPGRPPVNQPPMYPPYQSQGMYWQQPYQAHNGQQTNSRPGGANYPQGQPQPPRPGAGILSAFKTKDGKFDFDKASTTIDQVVKVGNQISPLVKQVGSFFSTKN